MYFIHLLSCVFYSLIVIIRIYTIHYYHLYLYYRREMKSKRAWEQIEDRGERQIAEKDERGESESVERLEMKFP